jgi:hypothetical protein
MGRITSGREEYQQPDEQSAIVLLLVILHLESERFAYAGMAMG